MREILNPIIETHPELLQQLRSEKTLVTEMNGVQPERQQLLLEVNKKMWFYTQRFVFVFFTSLYIATISQSNIEEKRDYDLVLLTNLTCQMEEFTAL